MLLYLYAVPNGPKRETQRIGNKNQKTEKGKGKKSGDTQTSLKRKLPEYVAFIWSCRAMHLLLDIARVVEGVVAELGSERLEALLILRNLVLRGRSGLGRGKGRREAYGGGV